MTHISVCLSLSHSLSYTHTCMHTHIHTHTQTHSHTHTRTHTHTHKHRQRHNRCMESIHSLPEYRNWQSGKLKSRAIFFRHYSYCLQNLGIMYIAYNFSPLHEMPNIFRHFMKCLTSPIACNIYIYKPILLALGLVISNSTSAHLVWLQKSHRYRKK